MADWVGRAAFLRRPVHERPLETLKASGKLFVDETTAPVLMMPGDVVEMTIELVGALRNTVRDED